MLSTEVLEKIRTMADEVCRREECQLYDIEFLVHSRPRILRVYIEGEKSTVSVEQCANVSRGISFSLDAEDLISEVYELEVSSPGLERQLSRPWHFMKVLKQNIKVITHQPIASLKGEVKSIIGELQAANEDEIVVTGQAQQLVSIPYSNIKRANLVFDYKKNEKKR